MRKLLILAFVLMPLTVWGQGQNFPGGGVSGIVAGQNSVTLSINVADPKYGAKFNGKMFTSTANTCSWTATQTTFTCTGANFTGADVGKQVSATINSAGGVGAQYNGTLAFANVATTITSVQSSTQATISQAFTSSSGANWIIAWATNDDAALSAAETDWAAANKCSALILPAGITAVLQAHFISPGTNCLGVEPQADYTAQVQGQGLGATIIGLFPGFNFASCTGGVANTACFGGYKEQSWMSFQFNGFGFGNTGAAAAHVLIETGLGSQLSQFGCNAFGGSDSNLIGISHDIGSRLWGMAIDGCGKVGCQVNATIVKYYYSFCGDNLGANLELMTTSDLTDFGSDYGGSGGTQVLVFNGNNSRYHGIGSNLFGCGIANSTAIYVGNTTGNTAIIEGGRWNCGSTTSNGIYINSSTDNVYLYGTVVGGTSNAINIAGGNVFVSGSTLTSAAAAIGGGAAGSKVVDLCGNSYVGTILTSNLLFSPCLTATYATAIPQVTTTGSTGACATITTQTGNIFNGKLTCTAATAGSTVVLTPGITAQNGWNCKNSQDITTTANTFVQTGISATTCTLTAASVTQNDVIEFSLQQF